MGLMQPIMNRVERSLQTLIPWAFGGSTKHNFYADYGWPENPEFHQFHQAYCRNGLAAAAVDKTVAKTWETTPALWETEKAGNTPLEQAIAKHFAERRIWQALSIADTRGMVGAYAGAILLLADGKKFEEPVDRVPGAILGLAGVIPAWEGQLEVAEWDTVETSPTYSQPRYFQFNEAAVEGQKNVADRVVRIHPDRVIVWSQDGTLNCRSTLEPGYNDLIDADKVKGAGGEGFWKSSRGAPIVEAAAGMNPDDIIKMFSASTGDEAHKKLNERADDFQAGFDKMLLLGGLTAKPMQITLPVPEHFYNIPVMSFAASMQMPVRILIGNQTGERASTEDAREWAQTCMSRRENIVLPLINELIRRLVKWGVLPAKEWTIGWTSLLDATPDQQLDRAAKMAEINKNALSGDAPPFTPEEIREAAGFDPDDGDWDSEDRTIEDAVTEKVDPNAPPEPEPEKEPAA